MTEHPVPGFRHRVLDSETGETIIRYREFPPGKNASIADEICGASVETGDILGAWFCTRMRHDPDDWHEAGMLGGKVVVAWRAPTGPSEGATKDQAIPAGPDPA